MPPAPLCHAACVRLASIMVGRRGNTAAYVAVVKGLSALRMRTTQSCTTQVLQTQSKLVPQGAITFTIKQQFSVIQSYWWRAREHAGERAWFVGAEQVTGGVASASNP